MSYLKKKSNKRLDFLPNINNKYSIRKFTVGTRSILVGATLIFGVAHDEAKGEDTKTEEGVTSNSNESAQSSSETKKHR